MCKNLPNLIQFYAKKSFMTSAPAGTKYVS